MEDICILDVLNEESRTELSDILNHMESRLSDICMKLQDIGVDDLSDINEMIKYIDEIRMEIKLLPLKSNGFEK